MCIMYIYNYHQHSVYNHIKPPTQIGVGCDYMLFKVNSMNNNFSDNLCLGWRK